MHFYQFFFPTWPILTHFSIYLLGGEHENVSIKKYIYSLSKVEGREWSRYSWKREFKQINAEETFSRLLPGPGCWTLRRGQRIRSSSYPSLIHSHHVLGGFHHWDILNTKILVIINFFVVFISSLLRQSSLFYRELSDTPLIIILIIIISIIIFILIEIKQCIWMYSNNTRERVQTLAYNCLIWLNYELKIIATRHKPYLL